MLTHLLKSLIIYFCSLFFWHKTIRYTSVTSVSPCTLYLFSCQLRQSIKPVKTRTKICSHNSKSVMSLQKVTEIRGRVCEGGLSLVGGVCGREKGAYSCRFTVLTILIFYLLCVRMILNIAWDLLLVSFIFVAATVLWRKRKVSLLKGQCHSHNLHSFAFYSWTTHNYLTNCEWPELITVITQG